MVLFTLIFIAAMLIGPVLLGFVFPVAVNEGIKNFKAVGRSFKLVTKRFRRVLGANLLVGAVLFVVFIAFVFAVMYIATNRFAGPFDSANLKIMFYVIFGIEALVTLLLLPYGAALNTVLYFDARVRTEGEGWLNYAKAEDAGSPVEEDTAYEEEAGSESELSSPENGETRDSESPEGE
jgi:hypothetical protein